MKPRLSLKANYAIALIAFAVAASGATLAAGASSIASPGPTESALHVNSRDTPAATAELDGHVIKLDNTKGEEQLEFRENLRQRQCVAIVKPDFLTLAPGETAEVKLDIRDSALSGCEGEAKHVLWNITSTQANGRTLRYMMLFSLDPKMDTHGRTRIGVSTRFSRPGTPYAAMCGVHACLDEWVPLDDNRSSTVSFYPGS